MTHVVLYLLQFTLVGTIPVVPGEIILRKRKLSHSRDVVLHVDAGVGLPEKANLFVEWHGLQVGGPGVDSYTVVTVLGNPIHHGC